MEPVVASSPEKAQPALSPLGLPPGERRRRTQAVLLFIVLLYVAILLLWWRVATFRPQPLDSASTLRPFLYSLFSRFIKHYGSPEQAFSAWYTYCEFALLIPPALAVLNYIRQRNHSLHARIPGWLCSRTLLFASIGACFLFCRYPTFLEPELNADEGQFLSSADKLFYDADFFRADDCGTSGPVNIYPLMLPAVFGITPDFASSRVIALAPLFGCIWLLYATIRLVAPDAIARLAILPAAGMFAAFKNVGLVEYSSEDVPVLLASISLYAAVRVLRNPVNYRFPLFLIGFLSSAACLAKLQAGPIMATLALIAIAYVYITRSDAHTWRPALYFIAGVVPLPLLHAALCLATGVWHDFWMSYIVTNLYYADLEARFVTDMPQLLAYLGAYDDVRVYLFSFLGLSAAYVFQRLRRPPISVSAAFVQSATISAAAISIALLFYISNLSAMTSYLALIAIAAAPIYLLLRWHEMPLGKGTMQWFGLLALLFTLASAVSVYEAHRPFPHYLLFLFIPLSTVVAWMLIRQTGDGSTTAERSPFATPFIGVLVLLTIVGQAYLWGTQDDHVFKYAQQTIRAPEGDFIRSITTPEGKIAVWGWTVAPYLASGRVPATRDTNMANFFRWPAITAYYRKRFLHDMQSAPPELFIDAVGPASFAFTDPSVYGFQKFPEIEFFVNTHYVHVADRYAEHYYLRRDLAAHYGLQRSQ